LHIWHNYPIFESNSYQNYFACELNCVLSRLNSTAMYSNLLSTWIICDIQNILQNWQSLYYWYLVLASNSTTGSPLHQPVFMHQFSKSLHCGNIPLILLIIFSFAISEKWLNWVQSNKKNVLYILYVMSVQDIT
jgi:hypothetical protein